MGKTEANNLIQNEEANMDTKHDKTSLIAKVKLEELLINHQEIKQELLNIFKGHSAAFNWMMEPKIPLENKSPASLLGTNPNAILDMLYRIKTGDFS